MTCEVKVQIAISSGKENDFGYLGMNDVKGCGSLRGDFMSSNTQEA